MIIEMAWHGNNALLILKMIENNNNERQKKINKKKFSMNLKIKRYVLFLSLLEHEANKMISRFQDVSEEIDTTSHTAVRHMM